MAVRGTNHYVETAGEVDSGDLRVTKQAIDLLTQDSGGDLRVTRQAIDLLTQDSSGDLRVTRQYISLLVASDVIVNASASNTLSFTHSAGLNLPESVTSNLVLSDQVSRGTPVSASNILIFRTEAYKIHFRFDRNPVENTLNFSQLLFSTSNPQITSDLALLSEVDVRGPIPITVEQPMILSQEARNRCHNERLSQSLLFTNVTGVPFPATAQNTLSLTQEATITNLSQTINFVQTLESGKSVGVEVAFLTLVQTLDLTGSWTRPVTQDVGIGHALTYFSDAPCAQKSYTPFSGENTTLSTSPPSELPPENVIAYADRKFRMYYPSTGEPTTTVELRAPELDNRERLAFTRVNQETRGGELIVFADPIWPDLETIVVTFTALLKSEIEEILSFFEDYLGEEIGVTDWEGRTWRGIISDPEQPGVQDGKEQWTISFSVVGSRVDPMDDQDLAIEQALAFTGDWARSSDTVMSFAQQAAYTVETP